MKLQSACAIGGWSLVSTAVIRQWLSTLRCRADYGDPTVDPVHPDFQGAKIYIFWHENILFPLFLRGHCNISMLLSRHTDADILARVAQMMGFGAVRGSSYHGGSAALRELVQRAKTGSLTMTPDGPRGPRRRLAAGCVFLASTLGIPLVAMGFGYDRPWRAGTWDRFAIPRPGSRGRAVVSRAIQIPADLDREALEWHRTGVQRLLNHLSDDAERWAVSGGLRPGDRAVRPQVSRTARWAAAVSGAPGVSLLEEFERLGISVDDSGVDRLSA